MIVGLDSAQGLRDDGISEDNALRVIYHEILRELNDAEGMVSYRAGLALIGLAPPGIRNPSFQISPGQDRITNIALPLLGQGPALKYNLRAAADSAIREIKAHFPPRMENPTWNNPITDITFIVPYSTSHQLDPNAIERAWRQAWE
jgi:hypothetical protein